MTDEGSKKEIVSGFAQTVGALTKLKAIMERQEDCPPNSDWCVPWPFHIPVRV